MAQPNTTHNGVDKMRILNLDDINDDFAPTKDTNPNNDPYNFIRKNLESEGIISDTPGWSEIELQEIGASYHTVANFNIFNNDEIALILDEVEKRDTGAFTDVVSNAFISKILNDDLLNAYEKQILLAKLNKNVESEHKEDTEVEKSTKITDDSTGSHDVDLDIKILSIIEELEKISIDFLGDNSLFSSENIN